MGTVKRRVAFLLLAVALADAAFMAFVHGATIRPPLTGPPGNFPAIEIAGLYVIGAGL